MSSQIDMDKTAGSELLLTSNVRFVLATCSWTTDPCDNFPACVAPTSTEAAKQFDCGSSQQSSSSLEAASRLRVWEQDPHPHAHQINHSNHGSHYQKPAEGAALSRPAPSRRPNKPLDPCEWTRPETTLHTVPSANLAASSVDLSGNTDSESRPPLESRSFRLRRPSP